LIYSGIAKTAAGEENVAQPIEQRATLNRSLLDILVNVAHQIK